MSTFEAAAVRESALAFWQERKPRERKALTLGALAVAAALLYALVLAPALEGRQRLASELPRLRQQAAELQLLAKEAARFGEATGAPAPAPTRDSVERSLRAKGLAAQSVVVDSALTRVQLTGVSFASLLDWVSDVQRTAQLAVVDASIVAQPGVDTVNATLTLAQPKGGQ